MLSCNTSCSQRASTFDELEERQHKVPDILLGDERARVAQQTQQRLPKTSQEKAASEQRANRTQTPRAECRVGRFQEERFDLVDCIVQRLHFIRLVSAQQSFKLWREFEQTST